MNKLIDNDIIKFKIVLNKIYKTNSSIDLIKYNENSKEIKELAEEFIKLYNNLIKSKEEFIFLQNIFLKINKFQIKSLNDKIINNLIKVKIKEYIYAIFDKNKFNSFKNIRIYTNKNTQNIISNELKKRLFKIKELFSLKILKKYNVNIISIYYYENLTYQNKINYFNDVFMKINNMFNLYDEYSYLVDKYKYEIEQLIKIDMFDLYFNNLDVIMSEEGEDQIINDVMNNIINKLEDDFTEPSIKL